MINKLSNVIEDPENIFVFFASFFYQLTLNEKQTAAVHEAINRLFKKKDDPKENEEYLDPLNPLELCQKATVEFLLLCHRHLGKNYFIATLDFLIQKRRVFQAIVELAQVVSLGNKVGYDIDEIMKAFNNTLPGNPPFDKKSCPVYDGIQRLKKLINQYGKNAYHLQTQIFAAEKFITSAESNPKETIN